jgi:hypothetical protein
MLRVSSEKTAAVRLTLNNRGFIAGFRTVEGAVGAGSKRMQSRLGLVGSSLRSWLGQIKAIAKALPGLAGSIAANPYGSMMAGLRAMENRSKAAFKRIGSAARAAFGNAIFGKAQYGKHGGVIGREGGLLNSKKLEPGAMAHAAAIAVKDAIIGVTEKTLGLVKDAGGVEEKAAQISVTARQAGGKAVDPKQLEAEFYAVTQKVKGTTAEEAADATARFLTMTGDLDTARKSLIDFAIASKATGAKMGDVAEATASISKQFGVTDPNQIREILAALTYQGKAGAIELPDLAAGLQKLAAAGAAFGMSKDVSGVTKLGALTQMARAGTGNREQAFTAVENLFKDILEKTGELKKGRVNVYEGKGANKKTRAVDDIIIDAISKLGGGNLEKKNTALGNVFGTETMRMLNPLVSKYMDAYRGAEGKGGKPASEKERREAGVAALRQSFAEASSAAGSWSDVVADSAMMQQTNSAKMASSWENLKGKIGEAVLPKLGDLVDKLTSSTDAIDLVVVMLETLADVLNAIAKFAKAVGLIRDKVKGSGELRADAASKAEKKRAELAAMQMRPEDIEALGKSDPQELAKRRAKAFELEREIAGAEFEEDWWAKKEKTDPFDWETPGAKYLGAAPAESDLSKKFEEARQRVGGAAVAGPGGPGQPAAAPPEQTAAPRPKGPMDVRPTGITRVHIVGDDTGKGAGAPGPAPARIPRK